MIFLRNSHSASPRAGLAVHILAGLASASPSLTPSIHTHDASIPLHGGPPARVTPVRLSIQNLENRVVPAAFTPGNVVIYRVGDGAAALSGNGSAVFLDEYTPTGTLVQTVAMPTTANGNQKQLISGGNATAEGLMTRSADGNYLMMMGYARDLGGTTALSGTSPAAVPRVVGRVFADGSIDTSVAVTDMPAGSGCASRGRVEQWDRPLDHHPEQRYFLHRRGLRHVHATEQYRPHHAVRQRLRRPALQSLRTPPAFASDQSGLGCRRPAGRPSRISPGSTRPPAVRTASSSRIWTQASQDWTRCM